MSMAWIDEIPPRDVVEEEIARQALDGNCGYAVITEQTTTTYTITTHYIISPMIPPMHRVAFPGWDAWHEWIARRMPI